MSCTMESPVLKRREASALVLTLNRPEDLNRIDSATMLTLAEAFDEAESDPQVRSVVLAGSTESFCAGGRIDGHPGGAVSRQLAYGQAFCALQERMGRSRLPIIAALEGNCVAGGMSLLAACDLAVVAEGVHFAYPEINYGLFPVLAMGVAIPLMDSKVALELFYTGRSFSASEALRLNLVNRVVSAQQVWSAVMEYVDMVANRSPFALALGRKGFYAMQGMSPAARLDYAQTLLTTMINSSEAGAIPVKANGS